jgi:hypothetical protein
MASANWILFSKMCLRYSEYICGWFQYFPVNNFDIQLGINFPSEFLKKNDAQELHEKFRVEDGADGGAPCRMRGRSIPC